MLARLLTLFLMIGITLAIGAAIFPVIDNSFQEARMNISSTPTAISGDLLNFLEYAPYLFVGVMVFMAIVITWKMFMGGNDGLGDANEDYTGITPTYYNEDEEDEEEVKVVERKTIVTTTKKSGEKKTNVKLSKGYNVDKYELDKPEDNKLTVSESTFSKTKFD